MIDHQINASYGDTISFDAANLVSIFMKLGRCIELKITTCDGYIPCLHLQREKNYPCFWNVVNRSLLQQDRKNSRD